VEGEVRLEVCPGNVGYLRISVVDGGYGLSEANIEQLFQPFNRLNAEDTNIEGSGIGLTITRRLVEMMGGSIGVESEVGVGSRFWIELPLDSSLAVEGDV
jgi:signal transduction histidine kinase